jgi:peptidoglycan/LPS O-acetylase OafA/YrhL
MGFLRLFFAYVVLVFHFPQGILERPLHPALAVQCFYVISGFYMQLVIGKYFNLQTSNWKMDFYKSRFVRIFSLYYIFLLLTVITNFGWTFSSFNYFVSNKEFFHAFLAIVNNITIFGQSILRFFFYDSGSHNFIFVGNHSSPTGSGVNMTALIMSWTLEIELLFYLLAPFILLRSSKLVISLIFLSISIRLFLGFYGYNQHSWLYGFFPSELAIFLIGSMSCRFYMMLLKFKYRELFTKFGLILKRKIPAKFYQAYERIRKNTFCLSYKIPQFLKFTKNKNFWLYFIYILISYSLLNFYYRGWHSISGGGWDQGIIGVPHKYWYTILYTAALLPLMFFITKDMKIDRFIGNLSYPVYLGHGIVLVALSKSQIEERLHSLYGVILTTILAIFVVILLENPIDRYRHRKFLHKKTPKL